MADVTSALEYWPSPPPWGWTADDLDLLPSHGPNGEPDFFKHVELIDGALVFMSPRRRFHERVINAFRGLLNAQGPVELVAVTQMDIKLGKRMGPCPDVLVVTAAAAVSPESEDRDRFTKPLRYAQAGVPHFWRVEESDGLPVVYIYELDPASKAYAITGIHHGRLAVGVPYPIDIDLANLPR